MSSASTAIFTVTFAGPHTSFQDAGRFGSMRFGVPASGPMDRLAHAAANLAIGNPSDATAIEMARGGLVMTCDAGAVTVAVTGGDMVVDHADERTNEKTVGWSALSLRPGQRLTIKPGTWGGWAYLAVAGGFDASRWLGSAATHSMSGFGGGAVRTGQQIVVDDATVRSDREGEIPMPSWTRPTGDVRVVMGPQDHHFTESALAAFGSSAFRLTDASDRMGVRLDGPPLALRDVLSIPSEPIVRGSIQVAGDGVPTILLADHQTTGGYPKIATVIGADVDRVAQMRSGDEIRFLSVRPDEAIGIVRATHDRESDFLDQIAGPGRTLAHRLRAIDIIGDVHQTDDVD